MLSFSIMALHCRPIALEFPWTLYSSVQDQIMGSYWDSTTSHVVFEKPSEASDAISNTLTQGGSRLAQVEVKEDPFFLSELYHTSVLRHKTPSNPDDAIPGTSRYDYYEEQKEAAAEEARAEALEEDQDKSGDYDPLKERKGKKASGKAKANQKKPKPSDDDSALPADNGSTSDNANDVSQQQPDTKKPKAKPCPVKPVHDDDLIQPTRLRSRLGASSAQQDKRMSFLGGPELPPEGCIPCVDEEIDCNLMTGDKWPCTGCKSRGVDCELLFEPEQKRQCENCRHLKSRCSFQANPSLRGPCQLCSLQEKTCIAGPKEDASTTKTAFSSLDSDPAVPKKRALDLDFGKELRTCKECRDGNAQCSWVDNPAQYGDCNRCVTLGRKCGYDIVPAKIDVSLFDYDSGHTTKKRRSSPLKPDKQSWSQNTSNMFNAHESKTPVELSDSDSDESAAVFGLRPAKEPIVTPKPASKPAAHVSSHPAPKPAARVASHPVPHLARLDMTRPRHEITTRLAHPLVFTQPGDRCNWCADLVYGFNGCSVRRVTVIDQGRDGLFEIGGQMRESSEDTNHICSACLDPFIQTISCGQHAMQAIKGMDPNTFDWELVTAMLHDGRLKETPFKWCSVCPGAAFYKCGTRDEAGECRLVLCEECTDALMNLHGGNLDALVRAKMAARAQPNGDQEEMRADAELFLYERLEARFTQDTISIES